MMANIRPGLPRRREVMAVVAILALLSQLVLAQLTLAFAVLFVMVGRVSRWRRSWLLAPVTAGLVWALTAGLGHVIEGFVAGPAQVLSYFGHGHVLGRLSHPLAGFAAAGSWLPRQLPVALIAGAVEAAAIGWIERPRAGQPTLPPRPGAVAALRGALAARMIRTGAVLTRDGCALGMVPATGAVAGLRWAEIADGALVTGPEAMEVTVTCLQVVHAALRRRKPLIVIDSGNDAAIARAVAVACAATGTPLLDCRSVPASTGRGAAGYPDARIDLVRVVSERLAVLLSASSPQLAELACADIAALAAELRRIGVDGDGLIWVPAGESLPEQALAELIRDGSAAGLPVLIGAVSPAMTELAGSARTVLTLAPRSPSRRAWEFSLAVQALPPRQLPLARVIAARLPPIPPPRLPPEMPARPMREAPVRLRPDTSAPLTREMPTWTPREAARPGGRP